MKITLLLLLLFMVKPVFAEVFKCMDKDKNTVYQSKPCEGVINQQPLAIKKPNPQQEADAEARLKAWQAEQDRKKSEQQQAQEKAQKEAQERLDKQAQIDALNRSAKAQEELANSIKQRAIYQQPIYVSPYWDIPHPHKPHRYPLPSSSEEEHSNQPTDRYHRYRRNP